VGRNDFEVYGLEVGCLQVESFAHLNEYT